MDQCTKRVSERPSDRLECSVHTTRVHACIHPPTSVTPREYVRERAVKRIILIRVGRNLAGPGWTLRFGGAPVVEGDVVRYGGGDDAARADAAVGGPGIDVVAVSASAATPAAWVGRLTISVDLAAGRGRGLWSIRTRPHVSAAST